MKILYGVQATGNGHISRARAMARAMRCHPALQVDWLFSGRPLAQLFDMEKFGDFRWRHGLTFASRGGRVCYRHTVRQSHPAIFVRDCRQLDLSHYDMIISDFEPITAWAGRIQQREVLGIGHQYAFCHHVPRAGDDGISSLVMRYYAPVTTAIGLHWHHFDQPVLPPILDFPDAAQVGAGDGCILIYLPFEDPDAIMALLAPHSHTRFLVYHPQLGDSQRGHIATRGLSTVGFKSDLIRCSGVICNAGFELIAEALALGKKVLAKPLARQMEQLSNARALQQLGYAMVMDQLDAAEVGAWLGRPEAANAICWPDVASALSDWIASGCRETPAQLSTRLWSQIRASAKSYGFNDCLGDRGRQWRDHSCRRTQVARQ